MAGINDLYYAIGVTQLAVSGAGGTLVVPQSTGVIARYVYAESGTLFITGASQVAGVTNSLALTSLTVPVIIAGPAAFVLYASSTGGTAKVMNFFSQSGIPSTTQIG